MVVKEGEKDGAFVRLLVKDAVRLKEGDSEKEKLGLSENVRVGLVETEMVCERL